MNESKPIAQEDQRGQEGVQVVLFGSRPTNKRGAPDSHRKHPVEVTADGSFKLRVMPDRWVRLNGATLGTGATTVVRAYQDFPQVRIYVSNVDTSARTFALYHVPSGGAAADANAISKNVTFPANSAPILYEIGMSKGELLQGLTDSADKVAVTAYALISYE